MKTEKLIETRIPSEKITVREREILTYYTGIEDIWYDLAMDEIVIKHTKEWDFSKLWAEKK